MHASKNRRRTSQFSFLTATGLLSIVALSIVRPAWFFPPPIGAQLFFVVMVPLFCVFGLSASKRCVRVRQPVYEFEKGFIVWKRRSGKAVALMKWDDIQAVEKSSSRYGTTYSVLGKGGQVYRPVPRRFWLRCKRKLQEHSAASAP